MKVITLVNNSPSLRPPCCTSSTTRHALNMRPHRPVEQGCFVFVWSINLLLPGTHRTIPLGPRDTYACAEAMHVLMYYVLDMK